MKAWLKGGLIADIIFLVCLLVSIFFEWLEDYSLGGWNLNNFLGMLRLIIGIIGMPVSGGGWLFIWGDNGPPAFLANGILQIILGLVLWFIIGALIGFIVGKIKGGNK